MSMLTVVKDVPAVAPGTRESSGRFLSCGRYHRMSLTSVRAQGGDREGNTHVGHPVETLVSAVEEVVCLRDTQEAMFRRATGRGELPHHVECFSVDGWEGCVSTDLRDYLHGMYVPICFASLAAWLT